MTAQTAGTDPHDADLGDEFGALRDLYEWAAKRAYHRPECATLKAIPGTYANDPPRFGYNCSCGLAPRLQAVADVLLARAGLGTRCEPAQGGE